MQIDNLNISVNDNILFKNFSLELTEKTVTGISAPSGSGKTTLLNWMSGLLEKPFVFTPFKNFGRISYVFQEPCLLENLTVLQNVMLPLTRHSPKNESKQKALYFLEKSGLHSKVNEYPENLSGGEKHRVSVARAFANDCDLLLLDEPFSSLDSENKKQMIKLLKEFMLCSPVTAVFVSHDEAELNQLCSRIVRGNEFIR